jgi:hypothetical protein
MCPIYSAYLSKSALMVAAQVTIGMWSVSLQPVWAQATAGELFRVAPEDQAYRDWLTGNYLLTTNGWHRIWRRSLDMGASLAPFLRQELERAKNREHQLVLTGAYSLATRYPHAVLLGRKITERTVRDRFMALFTLAVGPRHGEGSKALTDFLGRRGLTALEQIAACLALARIADRPALPRQFTDKTRDPGVLAGALYCRPDRRMKWIAGRVKRSGAKGHRDLVWRGYLLGDSCNGDADRDRLELAVGVLRGEDDLPLVRREAAWYLAHSSAASSVLDRIPFRSLPLDLRLLLSHSKAFRSVILSLRSSPQATADKVLQRRWFALYSRSAPLRSLRKALVRWKDLSICRPVDVKNSIGLALARRLMLMTAKDAEAAGLDIDWLFKTGAGPWLRVARGEKVEAPPRAAIDTPLDRAFRLVVASKLSRQLGAEALEYASWRDGPDGRETAGGSNPGLSGLELHRQFLGELLIDGCRSAGKNFVDSGRKPYMAGGPGRTDGVFQVAYELFKFIRREEPWSVREHRLQN